MVDLQTQYQHIKPEIDAAIQDVLTSAAFINGPAVGRFQQHLEAYLGVKHVVPCANGTDALQIAMMALGLQAGDEVIVPAFTYVATAEVIALLGFVPVMIDVDPRTFNVSLEAVAAAITPRTRAIVPVHLFGQCSDMEALMTLAAQHGLFVVEDNAQAIGADYTFADGHTQKAGTIAHVGTTSFFPSKNLGGYGDGGAIMTNDDDLAARLRMIANHGQSKKYYHQVVGCNSRLDTLQAAILDVKLAHLDRYAAARQHAAAYYDAHLAGIVGIETPFRVANSTHVFHQYTLKVLGGQRDALKAHLQHDGIPSMVYYPLPLSEQIAFKTISHTAGTLAHSYDLADCVLSLPIHTEMNEEMLERVVASIHRFFK